MATPSLVILAAGRGQRFGGAKQLAPVGPAGETLLAYTVHRARRVGFEQIVIVTRPDLDAALRPLVSAAGRLSAPSSPLAPEAQSPAAQEAQEAQSPAAQAAQSPAAEEAPACAEVVHQALDRAGTVPAVLAARHALGRRPFAVVNADDLYPLAALEALRAWAGPGHAVLGFRLEDTLLPAPAPDSRLAPGPGSASGSTSAPPPGPVNRALCRFDDEGRLVGLEETSVSRIEGRYVGRDLGSGRRAVVAPEQRVSMNAWALQPSVWVHLEAAALAAAAAPAAAAPAAAAAAGAALAEGAAPARGHQVEVLLPVVMGALLAAGEATVACLPVDGCCLGLTWPAELAVLQAIVASMVAAGELPAQL